MFNRRIALLVILLLLFVTAFPGFAQEGAYTGVDVLFLVDQSGSMSGEDGQVATDPNGLRFQTSQFAMDWLGELANVEVSETGTIRMAAVYFGDPQIETILPWTALAPTGTDWSSQEANLNYTLSADRVTQSFHYTNFEQAFQQARDLFDRLPALPASQHNARVIVVITDGAPCAARDVDTHYDCTDKARNQDQLRRVDTLTQTAFPAPDYRVYIVGIEAAGESFWGEYGPLWDRILREPNDPTRAVHVDSPAAMRVAVSQFLQDIRTLISRTSLTVPCNLDTNGECQSYIPPYARLARIRIFKADIASPVNNIFITQPDGTTLDRNSAGITKSGDVGSIETWTIEFPKQGIWHVKVDGSVNEVEVEVDQNFVNAELMFDPAPATYYQWQSIPLAAFLYYNVNEKAAPARLPIENATNFPGFSNFPIDLQASITDPNATVLPAISIPLDPNAAGNPAPQFRGSFVAMTPGNYQVGLLGKVANANDPQTGSPPFIPVDTRTKGGLQTFTVHPANVTVEMDPLLQSQGGNWLETDGADFCVIINDPSTDMLIPNLNALRVEVALLRTSDGSLQKNNLPPSADGHCSFRGTVAPLQAGDYQIHVRGFLTRQPGSEEQVFDRPQPLVMHAAPINYITVKLLDPLPANGASATSTVLKPAPFFNAEPLTLHAVAYGSNGRPVDLGSLVGTATNPAPNPLTLSIRNAQGEDVTNSNALQRVGISDYELETTAYGPGSYQIQISGQPLNLRVCACAYAQDASGQPVGATASVIVERTIPIQLVYWAVGLALLLALIIFIVWRLYLYLKATSENPLTGTLYFYKVYEDVGMQNLVTENIGTLGLSQYKRNTKMLRARDIPTSTKLSIKSMELTNYSAKEMRQRGSVRIKARLESGQPRSFTVTPGAGMQELYQDATTGDRFYIEKDPDATD